MQSYGVRRAAARGAGEGERSEVRTGAQQPDRGGAGQRAPDGREQRRRQRLQGQQTPPLGPGQPHRAQPGEELAALWGGLEEGQQQGEQGEAGAGRDRGGVEAYRALLEG